MRMATFNIYWLGNKKFTEMSGQSERTEDDWLSIAQVISKLDADVIAFQEIVNLSELRKVLDLAGNLTSRHYRIDDDNHKMLGTGKAEDQEFQKVVLAYDETKYTLVAALDSSDVGRFLFGIRVRSMESQGEISVVGVHFKSGQPLFDDQPSADKRLLQCQRLAAWLTDFPITADQVVVLGDFNALYELEPIHPPKWQNVVDSLSPLRDGTMAEWWWEKPLADPSGGDRTTSYLEHLLIDFVMLSPALKNRIVHHPAIYAYDRDEEVTQGFQKDVRIRISDHRPVWVDLDISPL